MRLIRSFYSRRGGVGEFIYYTHIYTYIFTRVEGKCDDAGIYIYTYIYEFFVIAYARTMQLLPTVCTEDKKYETFEIIIFSPGCIPEG